MVDRDAQRLQVVADDLRVRGAKQVETLAVDLNELERHNGIIEGAWQALGDVDLVFIAHGTMADQVTVQQRWELALQEFKTNFLSVASLLTIVANRFEERRHGTVAVISSPAGDRGRQSNYVYGAAKGALTIFAGGLRNRLSKSGVTVITIKPALVDTRMTAHMKKGLLWVKPDVIARGIVRAVDAKRDVVYLPWFWRWIMLVIRLIPERIFKKTKL